MTVTSATEALTSNNSYTYATNTAGSSGAGTGTITDQNAAQDRFLKLLVAQLNNQDPMNPLDNAQMTSQIAQINTVTGIQQLNATVTGLSSQFAAMQGLQASSLIGHQVLTDGNKLQIDPATKKGSGTFELSGAASGAKVEISTAGGTVVGTVPLGSLEAGRHDFTWDAGAYAASGQLQFKVIAANGATPVSATPLVRNKVVSVGAEGGNLTLQFEGGGSAAYSAVRSIL